jgi:hypothetical protein
MFVICSGENSYPPFTLDGRKLRVPRPLQAKDKGIETVEGLVDKIQNTNINSQR